MTPEEPVVPEGERRDPAGGVAPPRPGGGPVDELAGAARAEAAALEAELEGLEAALGRLEEGTYGRCETCGAPIDDARLEAEPAAVRCRAHAPGSSP